MREVFSGRLLRGLLYAHGITGRLSYLRGMIGGPRRPVVQSFAPRRNGPAVRVRPFGFGGREGGVVFLNKNWQPPSPNNLFL